MLNIVPKQKKAGLLLIQCHFKNFSDRDAKYGKGRRSEAEGRRYISTLQQIVMASPTVSFLGRLLFAFLFLSR